MPGKIIKLREPLRIFDHVDTLLIFPSGIMMRYITSFSEGFDMYQASFEIEDDVEYEDVTAEYEGVTAPTWLENIDGDILKDIFSRFPLNSGPANPDGAAKGLTRQELADIIKDVPEQASPSGRLVSED